ncbi:hypothetical protein DL95DRAFT_187029 [Leptodontidium sp. 2 PMI_412]|nr:hypothetical protein DL95DRAFT_187029 [Leptodontidium sp. 2 PMI_412]
MHASSFITMLVLGLSAFAQAQRGAGGECRQSSDCISGLCFTDTSSTTGGRCRGSGNRGDICLVTKGDSCKSPLTCAVPNSNAAQGTCS